MGHKPNKCYRRITQQAYTRKEYISAMPLLPEGLNRFTFGNTKEHFPAKMSLIAERDVQVSAQTLLTCRIHLNKELKRIGEESFKLQIKTIPYHIAREHGLVGIAKAERFAKGMRLGFGKPIGRFARIHSGQTIFEIQIRDDAVACAVAREAYQIVTKKLPSKWKIIIEGISSANLIAKPNLPPKVREESKGGQAIIPRQVPSPKVGK